jgi:thioredoxin reductase (NADPH)
VGPDRLILYGRADCRLCDDMLAALRSRLGADTPVTIVDVDRDPALEARYGEHVPVLVAGEIELCRHRLDAAKLTAYLSAIR